MTSMTWYVNQLATIGYRLESINAGQLDTVVEFCPQPVHGPVQHPYCWIGHICCNFHGVFTGACLDAFHILVFIHCRALNSCAHPGVCHNVADQHPEVVERLSKEHFDWYESMIPYMINQSNTWEGPSPLESLYHRQKEEKGIPEWMPEDIGN